MALEDNEFIFYYAAKEVTYTVKYLEESSDKELAKPKSGTAKFGEEVTEEAIKIDGYELISDSKLSAIMKIEGNEIIFYYKLIPVGDITEPVVETGLNGNMITLITGINLISLIGIGIFFKKFREEV